jgi:hypothetical protein
MSYIAHLERLYLCKKLGIYWWKANHLCQHECTFLVMNAYGNPRTVSLIHGGFAPSFCFDVSTFVKGYGPLQVFYNISSLDQKKKIPVRLKFKENTAFILHL